jgi:hypothetical protein
MAQAAIVLPGLRAGAADEELARHRKLVNLDGFILQRGLPVENAV